MQPLEQVLVGLTRPQRKTIIITVDLNSLGPVLIQISETFGLVSLPIDFLFDAPQKCVQICEGRGHRLVRVHCVRHWGLVTQGRDYRLTTGAPLVEVR